MNYSSGIARFLRIHEHEYFYAKTTLSGVEIYRVPSVHDFGKKLKIISVVGSVPDCQANILTTIMNLDTKKTLVLRNECRFSHGQFNGTPEAKMYYGKDQSLLAIYDQI
ncbi:hypothetical protein SDC9_177066 [bioreactor metagenome]|uniref:Uncharacterized protein n=1 Tax=bioreactor metagenome TaxID=1076179 RepID=A0A645H171_9ZZZZ